MGFNSVAKGLTVFPNRFFHQYSTSVTSTFSVGDSGTQQKHLKSTAVDNKQSYYINTLISEEECESVKVSVPA